MDRPHRPDRGSLSAPGGFDTAALVARCRFPAAGTEVTCAASGGADSTALLVLAVAAGCRVTAVHVDHGLRAGSAGEADFVAHVAGLLGASFRSESVQVEPGPNLEARARQARFGVLPDGVMTGHTADDRAETMLINLLRGAGPAGMAAMGPSARRPLLDLRRHETRGLCEAMGLAVFEDPSNADPAFVRNRVRHELLPMLDAISGRDLVPVLTRQGDLFAGVAEVIDHEALAVDATSVAELRAAPEPVARAALRAWLLATGVGEGYPVDGAALDRIWAVVTGEVVATEVSGGWRVHRSKGRVGLSAPGPCKDARHG